MKPYLLALCAVGLAGCGKVSANTPPEAPYLATIEANCKKLSKLGRSPADFYKRTDCAILIGQYGWYGNGGGYFGTYKFYQPAFDQAARGWWGFHGTVVEGSDELWVDENSVSSWCTSFSDVGTLQPGESVSIGSGNEQCGHDPYPIKFDASVVGRTISAMHWSYVDSDGKWQSGEFVAKVVGIIDGGANLKLDKRTPHQSEQWGMSIPPDDYADMCQCTNNFSPPFVDGRPIVQPAPK